MGHEHLVRFLLSRASRSPVSNRGHKQVKLIGLDHLGNTVLQGVGGVLGVNWKVSVELVSDGWTQVTLVGLGVFLVPWSPAATISE